MCRPPLKLVLSRQMLHYMCSFRMQNHPVVGFRHSKGNIFGYKTISSYIPLLCNGVPMRWTAQRIRRRKPLATVSSPCLSEQRFVAVMPYRRSLRNVSL